MPRPKRPKYIHLPEEIYTLKLTDKQKLVFSNIASIVSNGGSYEFDNQWVSEWLGISTRSASGIVNVLVKKGFISSTLIYKDGTKQISKRVLKLTSIGMELLKVTPRNMKGDGGIEVDFLDNTKDSSSLVIKNKNKDNIDNSFLSAFEKFWELYDYKKNKPDSIKAWKSVNTNLYPTIYETVPLYIAVTYKTGEFPPRMYPATWIRGECWNDELPANDENEKHKWEEKMKGLT